MARWTTQGKINSEIKFKIYNTIFLYSEKEQIPMISTKL